MELIPLIAEDAHTLVVKGFAERKWAEAQNLCHLTTLLIPVFPDYTIQIQVRPERKGFPGCRDIFGGHVTLDQEFWPLLLGVNFDLPSIVLSAAVREANEELRIRNLTTNYQYLIRENDLHKVGAVGEFQWNGEGNVERSTLFVVTIRENCAVYPMDDIDKVFVSVEKDIQSLDDLRRKFLENEQYSYKNKKKAEAEGYAKNKANWQFADGAARVLTDNVLFSKLFEVVYNLPAEVFAPV